MPRPIRLILFIIIGILFLLYLYYSEYDLLPSLTKQVNLYFFTILASITSGWVVNFINQKLNVKIPWRRNIMLRFVTGLSLDFIALAIILITFGWLAEISGFIEFKMFASDLSESQLEVKLIVLSFLTLFIVTLVEFNSYSFNEFSVGQIICSIA
jgi:membrane protease YdiL (CAAX protease family)